MRSYDGGKLSAEALACRARELAAKISTGPAVPASETAELLCKLAEALSGMAKVISRLQQQLESCDRFVRQVNEALNSGDGAYRP